MEGLQTRLGDRPMRKGAARTAHALAEAARLPALALCRGQEARQAPSNRPPPRRDPPPRAGCGEGPSPSPPGPRGGVRRQGRPHRTARQGGGG